MKPKMTAVVTLITTADANEQLYKSKLQAPNLVSTAFDTLNESTNPNDVRLAVLMALQEAHDEESCLEEQMLNLMHRFADRFTRRRPKINRLKLLPYHPFIDYGRCALERMTGADMRNATTLKMARDELLRSMEENAEFIKNYKEM
ncbi:hypothetical protein Tco_1235533 [Tanacetum coccineum]